SHTNPGHIDNENNDNDDQDLIQTQGIHLTNIKLQYLPPNTIAYLQPCDALKYKQLYCHDLIQRFERDENINK
ncbi:9174_t:CDS:2, partial [Diversispora eburnea]